MFCIASVQLISKKMEEIQMQMNILSHLTKNSVFSINILDENKLSVHY